MIQINELRTGNLLNYDTSEGRYIANKIDWQDLKWLDEDAKGFNLVHTPIPLTEQWIKELGFEVDKTHDKYFIINDGMAISMADGKVRFIQGNFVLPISNTRNKICSRITKPNLCN